MYIPLLCVGEVLVVPVAVCVEGLWCGREEGGRMERTAQLYRYRQYRYIMGTRTCIIYTGVVQAHIVL